MTPAARDRVAPAAAVAVVLAVAGVVAVLWRPAAPALPAVATDLDEFAPELLARVRAYQHPRWVGGLASLTLSVVVPLGFVATRRGRAVVARLAGGRAHTPLRAVLVVVTIAAATWLARLPVRFWIGYLHERHWGFRTGTWLGWLQDQAVTAGTALAAVVVATLVAVAAIRRWPRSWPWRLVPIATALAALLVALTPLVVQPLLLDTRPLGAGPARQAVQRVLDRAGESDLAVAVGDASRRTTKANAYVTGLGPSRQVVLFDTLLELPAEHVAVVVAHELAHREHRDIARGVLAVATGTLLVALPLRRVLTAPGTGRILGARGPTDPRALPAAVLLLAVAQVVALPATTWASRRAEAAADHRALALSREPAALIETLRTFVTDDLASPAPPAWTQALWGTHPSIEARIEAAVAAARQAGIDLPPLHRLRQGRG